MKTAKNTNLFLSKHAGRTKIQTYFCQNTLGEQKYKLIFVKTRWANKNTNLFLPKHAGRTKIQTYFCQNTLGEQKHKLIFAKTRWANKNTNLFLLKHAGRTKIQTYFYQKTMWDVGVSPAVKRKTPQKKNSRNRDGRVPFFAKMVRRTKIQTYFFNIVKRNNKRFFVSLSQINIKKGKI